MFLLTYLLTMVNQNKSILQHTRLKSTRAAIELFQPFSGNWTICRQTNSWSVNSQNGQLGDWTISGLFNLQTANTSKITSVERLSNSTFPSHFE